MRRIRAVIAGMLVAVLALMTFHSAPAADEEVSEAPTSVHQAEARSEGSAMLAGIQASENEAMRIALEQARLAEEARRAQEAAQRARERASTTTTPRAAKSASSTSGDVWAALRQCESGGNYAANTGNGYYGAYQFSASTWRSMGTGYAYAHEAPPAVQDDAAQRLQARSGWGQWPACSRKLGLR